MNIREEYRLIYNNNNIIVLVSNITILFVSRKVTSILISDNINIISIDYRETYTLMLCCNNINSQSVNNKRLAVLKLYIHINMFSRKKKWNLILLLYNIIILSMNNKGFIILILCNVNILSYLVIDHVEK